MSFSHPFPAIRPSITIAECDENITQINLPELQWWPIIPSPGERSMQATYEAETLELSAVTEMMVTDPARVHDLNCVEIAVQEQEFGTTGMSPAGRIFSMPGLTRR